VYDGYISRYINRRISNPIARLLAKTRITPNQITWAAFGIAVLSFISFALSHNIIGGILAQLSSIVDGVDGSLARLKSATSTFGGFLDSMLDRFADILILLGLTLWSISHELYPGIWLVGLFAVTGTICISYSRALLAEKYRQLFDKGPQSLASRDIRLFLIMVGALTGQGYYCLIAIAILTNLIVLYRLVYFFKYLKQEAKNGSYTV